MKSFIRLLIIGFFCLSLLSCHTNPKLNNVLELSGSNRSELEKVLKHYKDLGDKQKLDAAVFLISNMENAYSYQGENLKKYDTIFSLFDSLYQAKIYKDPPFLKAAWDSLIQKNGPIDVSKLDKVYDCKTLKADFLIRNIDAAFEEWQKSPLYDPNDFDLFCEFILPYRAGREPVEEYRQRYYKAFKHILDTAQTRAPGIVSGFGIELSKKRHFKVSHVFLNHPLELSVSKMEKGHRGVCRQLTNYTTLVMRSCGLPVAMDRAIWANRSEGHSWNVLLLKNGAFIPFNALETKRKEFAYKPAKIFRRTFSSNYAPFRKLNLDDVPAIFFTPNEIDVTAAYGHAFDVKVPIKYPYKGEKRKKFGVICTFNNHSWAIVYWGKISWGNMHFKDMCSDVVYMGAYYENGKVIPATDPFLLQKDGKIRMFEGNGRKYKRMSLERKYPLFIQVERFAWGLDKTTAEGANRPDFSDSTILFTITKRSFQVTDSAVHHPKKFRYVRFQSALSRSANFAEVAFYGKKDNQSPEEKLSGKIIGYPSIVNDDEHPYTHAMDGNLETWFLKTKNTIGWVGLDLGKGKERIITKVRFCPRSDTNFILAGDTYELFYWHQGEWKSMGKQIAKAAILLYKEVPSGTIYYLHNHSRGKEERIFSYEKGKQVWW
jgi:hypothetical protein